MRLQEASAAHDGMLPAHLLTSSRLLTWLAARVLFLQCFPIVQDFTRNEAKHDNEQSHVQCLPLHLKACLTISASRTAWVLSLSVSMNLVRIT